MVLFTLISLHNWTPLIGPYNNVIGRLSGYGGRKRQKDVFEHLLVIDQWLGLLIG
jgi:hypothetical protein